MRTTNRLGVVLLAVLAVSTGCGDSTDFSVLPTDNIFQQAPSSSNSKVDILWVIDNSGSMATSQTNLATNFPSFISGFSSRNLDFKMAVTGTDAYVALPTMTTIYNSPSWPYLRTQSQPLWGKFRDGWATHTGQFILDPLTSNLNTTFVSNVTLGTGGLGDERPFQSMKTTLNSSYNSGFLRPDSFLAVIMLTDEDDFSNDTASYLDGQYSNPAVHTVASYVQYLDTLTGSTPTVRRYNIHSIAIQDTTCLTQLNSSFGGRRIAQRVNALADATGGLKASLCGDFATQLQAIADNILQLSTQFYLSRIPNPSTIQVYVNSALVPEAATNPGPSVGGWRYDSNANSIIFSGDYIPPAGSTIQVNFDPLNLGS